MHDTMYHFLVGLLDLFLWGGTLEGEENLPGQGPAVFVANHLDATGPIACHCSIPMRLHPWSVGDMMNPAQAPGYLNQDFVERQLHLKPPFSLQFSRFLARITVPMFHALGCIPVNKGDYAGMQETLERSMDVLRDSRYLLIFPEDPLLEAVDSTGIKPFLHTFARLGERYYAETGKRLAFYPVAVHQDGVVQVAEPILYNPLRKLGEERQRIKDLVESRIHQMYETLGGKQGDALALCAERK